MATVSYKNFCEEVLSAAGIAVNGSAPWDLSVRDERFYRRAVREGNLGMGESYMDGWWECEQLDEFFYRLLRSQAEEKVPKGLQHLLRGLAALLFNLSSKARAFQIGERHYDIGNELYSSMLDKRMMYSCGYWSQADDLDAAQEAKLDLICRKIGLQSGDRLLDIGCGWGGFAQFAAEQYGARVVGITVSQQQALLAQERCSGLPIEIRLQDYRDLNEQFDHIVSIGMFEHVGHKNYRTYMETARRCLKDNGIFLLHTIGSAESHVTVDPWISKYIFPNSLIPSMQQISRAGEGLLVMEDCHNFGSFYDATLLAWFENFNRHWGTMHHAYDEKFYRMWKYYLLSCAGAFRARRLQLWQLVFSPSGVSGGYCSLR